VGAPLSSERYRSRRAPELELRARLRALAVERVRWGYRRLHVLLRREGVAVNVKRVYRLYREEGLAVRRRKRKRVAVARVPQPATQRINECWGMDFMSDVLVGGRRFRILNVVDVHSHEAVVGEVDSSLPASRVIRALEEAALERGYPQRITIDNGPEFRSAALDAWAYQHGVALEFIEPGKPMQNPFVESYNGKMRDELLNQHWWRTLDEARRAVANYVEDYNCVRPHSTLDDQTPIEFVAAQRSRDLGVAVA
jgi:putative transposase